MPATARLLLPPKALASCIAVAIYRDTRTAFLNDIQRMNYFPATPLVTITMVLQGQLHMGHGICELAELMASPPLPKISVAMPCDKPIVSWSSGQVVALTVAIYPDAWARITDEPDCDEIPFALYDACRTIAADQDIDATFDLFCSQLIPIWEQNRKASLLPHWTGSDKIVDWTRHIITTSMLAQRGRSARNVQRMIHRLTGRSRRTLEFYANLETLHRVKRAAPDAELAETALEAGFADQSHMGRNLKRATGFSPAALNERIATDEAFWCYRLLGERF